MLSTVVQNTNFEHFFCKQNDVVNSNEKSNLNYLHLVIKDAVSKISNFYYYLNFKEIDNCVNEILPEVKLNI